MTDALVLALIVAVLIYPAAVFIWVHIVTRKW